MAGKELYVIGDIGATRSRVTVMNGRFESIGYQEVDTQPQDYELSMGNIIDAAEDIVDGSGQVVAASMGIAGAVDINGYITKAGDLSPWIGKRPATALQEGLNLSEGRTVVDNDVVKIAKSQRKINELNKRYVDGNVITLSSGFGGALYWADGVRFAADEPGHEHLRDGGTCPCGQAGHAEAFISGKGVLKNHGVTMAEWLRDVMHARTFVTDAAATFTEMIERHKRDMGMEAQELLWTGGVAVNQAFLMHRVSERIRSHLGKDSPVMGLVTMGESAGLHGAMVDAQELAQAA